MSDTDTPVAGDEGRLATNILNFARILRNAGLPVGPGKVLDAVNAVQTVGITDRDDFYWTLRAVLVNRREQIEVFDQAFHIFWRNPRIMERMMSFLLPEMRVPAEEEQPEMLRRLADALNKDRPPPPEEEEREPEPELDATFTFSDQEILQQKDFEKMSADEMALARQAVRNLRVNLEHVPTRRFRVDPRGPRVDLRASLRAGLRAGGDVIPLLRKQRRQRHPPLVLLCDISGSMDRYSRMLLHFAHALASDQERVHTFVFGTRLTSITRYLRQKDVDAAVEEVSARVQDWSGGTRIGHCLSQFNRLWSRRVLGQGAVVLLITDGLDRDVGEGLAREMERLHKSCRRLIWLNPLLRFDEFEPRAQGMRAILPHVDEFRSAHNIQSLVELSAALTQHGVRRTEGVSEWRKMA